MNIYRWLDKRWGWVLGLGMLGLFYSTYRRLIITGSNRRNPVVAHPQQLPVLSNYPKVSLLIPAWDESEYLADNLRSALALRYPEKEIITCAGGQDRTYEIARQFEKLGVIVLPQTPGMGKQKALQQCFERSSGEIIYLTDADCFLDDASFEATISPILAGEEQVTTGYFEPFPEERANLLVEYQWRHHAQWLHSHGVYAPTLDGANSAIKRDVLDSIGGFTTPVYIGTDYALSKLISSDGYKIRSLPGSRVKTHYPGTVQLYLQQLSRWFRNRLVLGIRYKAWDDVLASLRGGGSAGLILGLPFIVWAKSHLVFSLWALLSFRAIFQNWLVVASSRNMDERACSLYNLRMAILFTPINLLGMARGIIECLFPNQSHKW